MLATAHGAPGQPVHTTIDPHLQSTTVNALGGQSGGVVVLNARNGNVLAMAGSAYSSPQPPGSTFKVITATSALENHDVKLSDTFPVVTQINPDPVAGARVVANAHDEACGGTFVQAFAKSCNSVFAPLAVKVGADNLVNTAEDYGYNQPVTLYNAQATAATQPSRMSIPSADELNAEPTHTDLSVTGFGQGKVLATPLGMASVAQTVANGGVRDPTPIVKDPALQSSAKPVQVSSKANARVLTGLMRAVVTEGTGVQAALPGIQVAGKTGTAELGPKPGAPPAPPGAADRPAHRRLVHRLRSGRQAEARDRGDADRRLGRRRHDGGADRTSDPRVGSLADGFAIKPRPQAAARQKSLRASPSAPKWSGLAAATDTRTPRPPSPGRRRSPSGRRRGPPARGRAGLRSPRGGCRPRSAPTS